MKRAPSLPGKGLAVLRLLAMVILFCGCAGIFKGITYYDPTTYKNLTDLKPEVLALYETFVGDSVDNGKIDAIHLKLAQMYEYEKGKGEKNMETTEQIKIIQDMFDDYVKDRLAGTVWNRTHLNNNKQNISEAFDMAIQTEWLKNKNQ